MLLPRAHDPEPPAHELVCARPDCRHPYLGHGPGGGHCLHWAPPDGEHCRCPGFAYVSPDGGAPTRRLG